MRHDHAEEHLRPRRHDRLLQEHEHDPYHARRKIRGPAYCPGCGATYVAGRWTWGSPEDDATEHVCPACQRMADHVPAAFLTITGQFAKEHAEEIHHLIRNHEARERAGHPLKRIMAEQADDHAILFTFTDARLARSIGEALLRAYQGELDYEHQKGEILLRVRWHR